MTATTLQEQAIDAAVFVNPLFKLTEREMDVAACVAEGLTNAAIGDRLDIAEGTVKQHVKSILLKLSCPAGVLGRFNILLQYQAYRQLLRSEATHE